MLYRMLLRLYPADFRRRYQDELEEDFEMLCRETRESRNRAALFQCYLDAAVDLAFSLPREWLRTPWLAAVIAAAVVAAAVFYYVVVRVYRAGSFGGGAAPLQSPELIWLMAAMVVVPAVIMLLIGIALRFGTSRSTRPGQATAGRRRRA
jgi:hypothetical protein